MNIYAKEKEKSRKFNAKGDCAPKNEREMQKNDWGSDVQIESAGNGRRGSLIEIARTGHIKNTPAYHVLKDEHEMHDEGDDDM